jgi:hypothetical protein
VVAAVASSPVLPFRYSPPAAQSHRGADPQASDGARDATSVTSPAAPTSDIGPAARRTTFEVLPGRGSNPQRS